MGESLTVLVPSSPEDAVRLFGDGAGVTVVGGGTIVVPSLALGRRSAERALLLHRAGLTACRRDGGRITIGADDHRWTRSATCPSRCAPPSPTSPTSRSAARRRSAATSAPRWPTRRAATCRAR